MKFEDQHAMALLKDLLKLDWRIEFCKQRDDGLFPVLTHSPAGFGGQSSRNEIWFVGKSIYDALRQVSEKASGQ